MKIKLSWIPFVAVSFLCVILRVYQVIFVNAGNENTFFSAGLINNVFSIAVIALFVLIFVLRILDKKTTPDYFIGRNFPAAIFLVIAGLLLFFKVALQVNIILSPPANEDPANNNIVLIIGTVLAALAGVVFCLMASNFFSVRQTRLNPILMLIPVVWCCFESVVKLMEYTKISTASKDMSDIVYMVLVTLFLLNISMVMSRIRIKNPVKNCYLYGMPAIVLIFSYTAVNVTNLLQNTSDFNEENYLSYIEVYTFFALGMFMLFMLINFAANVSSSLNTAESEQGAAAAEYQHSERQRLFSEEQRSEERSERRAERRRRERPIEENSDEDDYFAKYSEIPEADDGVEPLEEEEEAVVEEEKKPIESKPINDMDKLLEEIRSTTKTSFSDNINDDEDDEKE